MPEPTLTLLFEPRVGAVDRIIGLLRRRGFPIAGFTVERTHRPDVGRMTVIVEEPGAMEQVQRHLRRLPDVLEVKEIGDLDGVRREYLLVRVRCVPHERAEIAALLDPFGARIISVTAECLVLEASGDAPTLDAFLAELDRYGIEESARTSPLAIHRPMDRRTA